MTHDSSSAPAAPSRTRNYVLGLSSGYVCTFATVAVALWLTPFTLRYLDREQFAIFTLAADVLMWLTLLDLGISAALRIQAARLSGRPDPGLLNRLASTAFFAEAGVVLLVLVSGIALALVFPRFFPVRPDLQHQATVLVLLLLVGVAFSLGTQVFSALLIAHQQLHVDNGINLLNLFARTVLTVVLLKAGWGVYSLGLAHLAAKVTTSLLAVVRTFHLLPALELRWRHVSWDSLKGTGAIGIWFTLGGLAGILILSLDRVVTGRMVSVEMVTSLSLTGRLYALAGNLIEPIANTARPMLGQLFGQQRVWEAARAYERIFTLSTALSLVAAAGIFAGNGPFVAAWVGGQHYGGWLLDAGLAMKLLATCWVLPHRAVLTANLWVRSQVLCRLAEAALAASLAILGARYWGVSGIVLGAVLASFGSSVWFFPVLTARLLGRSSAREARLYWRFALLLVGLTGVAWFGRAGSILVGGFLGAALGGGLTAACGLSLVWFLVFDADLRRQALASLACLWAPRKPATTASC